MLTAPLRDLMDKGEIAPVPIRTLHFLVAHGASVPYSILGLARRIGPEAVAEHADLVADLIIGGLLHRTKRVGGSE